jgi:hypothetical protein
MVARHWSKWRKRKHHCQEMGWGARGRIFHVLYLHIMHHIINFKGQMMWWPDFISARFFSLPYWLWLIYEYYVLQLVFLEGVLYQFELICYGLSQHEGLELTCVHHCNIFQGIFQLRAPLSLHASASVHKFQLNFMRNI